MEGWLDHENGVQALKTWLTLQEEKLKKRHRIEDVASVQTALKDCQVVLCSAVCCRTHQFSMLRLYLKAILLLQELEELVKEKEKDLEKAEERGNALIRDEKAAAYPIVKETLTGLKQSWDHLDRMVRFPNPFLFV